MLPGPEPGNVPGWLGWGFDIRVSHLGTGYCPRGTYPVSPSGTTPWGSEALPGLDCGSSLPSGSAWPGGEAGALLALTAGLIAKVSGCAWELFSGLCRVIETLGFLRWFGDGPCPEHSSTQLGSRP